MILSIQLSLLRTVKRKLRLFTLAEAGVMNFLIDPGRKMGPGPVVRIK